MERSMNGSLAWMIALALCAGGLAAAAEDAPKPAPPSAAGEDRMNIEMVRALDGKGGYIRLEGKNLFFDAKDEFNLSELAYGFIAGQLQHAKALSGVLAPSVNSYKRLVPGYEAPVYIGWAQINRSALIRIPKYAPGQEQETRAELRCPDPSCSPYLAFTAMLAAALDGIDRKIQPPKPLNEINVYHLNAVQRKAKGVKELPGSLEQALFELDKDELIKGALGKEGYEAFRRAKLEEWEEYRIHIMDWEVERYLETV